MVNRIKGEKLYSVKEVIEILQLSREAVYDFVRDGRLKAYKFGGTAWRVSESDLNEFIFEAGQYQKKGVSR